MKKCIVISFSFMLLLLASTDILVYSHYVSNKELISKTLCINRDNPEVMCSGKCYLKDTLEQQNEKSDIPNPTKERKTQVYFVLPVSSLALFDNELLRLKRVIPIPNNFYTSEYLNEIFQPPKYLFSPVI